MKLGRWCQVTIGACLALALGCGAKPEGRAESEREAASEDGPAPPCSLNGMLFRDTPDTKLERCGSSGMPLDRAATRCIREAGEGEQPFVLVLEPAGMAKLSGLDIALVGAHFGGDYALRMYTELGAGEGERQAVSLMLTDPSSQELALMPTGSPLRCSTGAEPPDASHRPVAGVDAHRFDASACSEWIDAAANLGWVFGYDPAHVLDCED